MMVMGVFISCQRLAPPIGRIDTGYIGSYDVICAIGVDAVETGTYGFAFCTRMGQGYDEETRRRRMQVTRICEHLSLVERKRCLAYMARRNAAARMVVPSRGTSEASTLSAPSPPVLEAILYLEENDPMYRWFAFPVDAPLRGLLRPSRVIHERYLPCDPDGRGGREGYRLVTPLASMPPHDMPDVFDDEEPPHATKSTVPAFDDDAPHAQRALPRVTEVMLPTEAELEEGYVYGRLQVVSADYASSSACWSTYKPTHFECTKCI